MVPNVEDITLRIYVNKGPNQLRGVILNQGGASVHEQKVGEEVVAT
jgi:hypothetical protein